MEIELVKAWVNNPKAVKKSLTYMFKKYDTSQNGTLSKSELQGLMGKLCTNTGFVPPTPASIAAVWDEIDTDSSGELDFEETLNYATKFMKAYLPKLELPSRVDEPRWQRWAAPLDWKSIAQMPKTLGLPKSKQREVAKEVKSSWDGRPPIWWDTASNGRWTVSSTGTAPDPKAETTDAEELEELEWVIEYIEMPRPGTVQAHKYSGYFQNVPFPVGENNIWHRSDNKSDGGGGRAGEEKTPMGSEPYPDHSLQFFVDIAINEEGATGWMAEWVKGSNPTPDRRSGRPVKVNGDTCPDKQLGPQFDTEVDSKGAWVMLPENVIDSQDSKDAIVGGPGGPSGRRRRLTVQSKAAKIRAFCKRINNALPHKAPVDPEQLIAWGNGIRQEYKKLQELKDIDDQSIIAPRQNELKQRLVPLIWQPDDEKTLRALAGRRMVSQAFIDGICDNMNAFVRLIQADSIPRANIPGDVYRKVLDDCLDARRTRRLAEENTINQACVEPGSYDLFPGI